MKRRILSILTALALCLSLLPPVSFAAEVDNTGLCPHHLKHTDECGNSAPTEGQPCGHTHSEKCYTEVVSCVHEHDESCYSDSLPLAESETREPDACAHVHDANCYSDGILPAEGENKAADACAHVHGEDFYGDSLPAEDTERTPDACTHVCSVESGCVTRTLGCKHDHDETCGYVPADPGHPCGYECRLCPIEALVAALPRHVTEENRDTVTEQLQEILSLYTALDEMEQEQIDISPCVRLQEELDGASRLQTLEDGEIVGDLIVKGGTRGTDYTFETDYSYKEEFGATVDQYHRVLTIKTDTPLEIRNIDPNTLTKDRIVVESGVNANITLSGVNINYVDSDDPNGAALRIADNSTGNVTLTIKGTNTLRSEDRCAGIQKNGSGPDVGTLTIKGDGVLHVSSSYGRYTAYGAGIGGGKWSNTSNIVIESGTIDAQGGAYAAGIGGGSSRDTSPDSTSAHAYNITINGGTVTARSNGNNSVSGGAGIGGGNNGNGYNITINGGTVMAYGGTSGAGIGGGSGGNASQVTINGGNVTAYGGSDCYGSGGGAGIGSGFRGRGPNNITISGGVVRAVGGMYGDNIGKSASSDSGGNSFSTGTNGNAIIYADKITDSGDTSDWSGIIFQGGDGRSYGNVTLSQDITIDAGKTLTVLKGAALTIGSGKTLTNNGELIIAPGGVLAGRGKLTGSGGFKTRDLTEKMISVPTDLVYSGPDMPDRIAEKITLEPVTILGNTFSADTTGWELSVIKVSDLEYTVQYTHTDGSVVTKGVTVRRSGTELNGHIETYNGETKETWFHYGETITVKARPTPTVSPAAIAVAAVNSLAEPTFGEMAVFYGDKQVSAAAAMGSDGWYTMEVPVKDLIALGAKYHTSNYNEEISTLTAKFLGTDGMVGASGTVDVKLQKAILEITGATLAERVYEKDNRTAAVTGVTFDGLVYGEALELGTDFTAAATYDNDRIETGKRASVKVTLENTPLTENYDLQITTYIKAYGTIKALDAQATIKPDKWEYTYGDTITITVSDIQKLDNNYTLYLYAGDEKLDYVSVKDGSGTLTYDTGLGIAQKKVLIPSTDSQLLTVKYGRGMNTTLYELGTVNIVLNKKQIILNPPAYPYSGAKVDLKDVLLLGYAPNDLIESDRYSVYVNVSTDGKDVGEYTIEKENLHCEICMHEGLNTDYNSFYEITGGSWTIAPLPLKISGATLAPKNYDGTTDATVTGVTIEVDIPELDPNDIPDALKESLASLTFGTDYTATAEFDDANVGEDKPVTATAELLDTPEANNYKLTSDTVNCTGTITKADSTAIVEADEQIYIYGDTITVNVSDIQSKPAAAKGIMTASLTDMAQDTLYLCTADGKVLASAAAVNGKGTLTYDTTEKLLQPMIDAGEPQAQPLTVKYGGSANLNQSEELGKVSVTLIKKQISLGDLTAPYNGSNIVLNDIKPGGIVTGDDVKAAATATGKDAGQYTMGDNKLTCALRGSDSGFYEIIDGTLTIEKAAPVIAWSRTEQTLTYTGAPAAITAPTVTLVNNEAFTGTISYSYEKDGITVPGLPTGVGTYQIRASVAASGNYAAAGSTNTLTLTVNKAAPTATVSANTPTYNGAAQALVTGSATGGTLQYSTDGTNYSSAVPTETNAGTYTVYYQVAGDGNHEDLAAQSVSVTISPKTVTAAVTVTPDKYEYTGSAITPTTVEVKDGTTPIPAGEYTVKYENNTDHGTSTVTIIDKAGGNYIVSGSATFAITRPLLDTAEVTLSESSYTYDGAAKAPGVTVKKGGKVLSEGTDYTVTYSNNENASTAAAPASVTVTGVGNYEGSKTVNFTITAKTLTPTISGSTTKTYDGNTNATGLSITLDGVVNGDTVTASASSYTYNSPNVKDAKTITATGITLDGADKDNYTLSATTVSTAGSITKDTGGAQPAANEGYTINYTVETIAVTTGYEVSTKNDGTGTAVSGSVADYFGQTLYIRKVADDNHDASGWTSFALAGRPATPTPTATKETLKGQKNGEVSGVNGTMQYRENEGAWKDVPASATEITGLAGGTKVEVRVKATTRTPASAIASCSIEAGVPITVTFKPGTDMSAVMPVAQTGLSYNGTATRPADPVPSNADYEFTGWYADPACTTEYAFTTPLTTASLTLYAGWKQVKFEVGGTVVDSANAPVTGATVRLMQGNQEIDKGTSGTDGTFSFAHHVHAGAYNVVTTYGEQTKTSLVAITDQDAAVNVKLPPEGVNSKLAVNGAETPAVLVGGLDEEAAALKKDDVEQVTLSMTVEAKSEAQAVGADQIKALATTGGNSAPALEFLDVAITAVITKTNAPAATESIATTGTLMEIVVPFDFSGKQNVKVYRYHGSAASSLAEASATPADGTYKADQASGLIHIYANQFSTYAIGYTAEQYTVAFNANGGTVDTASAQTGTDGKLTSLPTPVYSGYKFLGWFTEQDGGTEVTVDNVFKADDTLYAHWTKKSGGGSHSGGGSSGGGSSTPAPVQPSTPEAGQPETPSVSEQFTDVPSGAWYREAVDFVVKTSLMTGYGNGNFGPDDNLSRAQLAQILFNKEGRPAGSGAGAFTDVAGNAWYAGAVAWAATKGIVGGYGNGRFGPNDPITREQLALMLWRYAGNPAATDKELHFTDADKASAYAREALRWAVEKGILNGLGGGRLDPRGLATRAQAAQMLKRYFEDQ